MRPRLAGPSALATSAVLHVCGLALGAWLLSRSLDDSAKQDPPAPPPVEVTVESPPVELPDMSRAAIAGLPDVIAEPKPEPVAPGGGGAQVPRPDQKRAGRGGAAEVAQNALNLSDSNDGLTLNRDPLNRLDRSQVQRLETARERRSWDDRRATPNPMQLSFLASGEGTLMERREPSKHNPSNGSLSGSKPQSVGSVIGGNAFDPGRGAQASAGGPVAGSERDRPGAGIPTGTRGQNFSRSAAVALARPDVLEARAAVPAPERGRPNDNVDSSQEVSSAVASLIHASTAGGRLAAHGPGGETGPGPSGSGGDLGPGSRGTPGGDGTGPLRSSGPGSSLGGYFGGIVRKVRPYWKNAFPTWAIADGRGGMAVIAVTLNKDGSLSNVKVARSSGISEFDANVMVALRRAAPYAPLPPALGSGPFTFNLNFDAVNPAVGRHGPGRGRSMMSD